VEVLSCETGDQLIVEPLEQPLGDGKKVMGKEEAEGRNGENPGGSTSCVPGDAEAHLHVCPVHCWVVLLYPGPQGPGYCHFA